ncbi:hypothetical protein EES44_14855 [Streptomyces sp. ADI96-15]|nr:hypothetical protein EES44_14855 [Streptomyces sp. ADI96-15]
MSSRARTASSASAKTGKRSYSSRPMPARCDPWPEKSRASERTAARPRAASHGVVPGRARSTARWSKRARPVAREWPTSSGAAPSSAVTAAICPSRASSDLADTGHGTTVGVGPGRRAAPGSAGSGAGACSMMVCALVPLMPKDEMPARQGRPLSGQADSSVSSRIAPDSQSTWVEGRSTWRVRGRTPWRIAMTVLMMPATPAAAWVWPMFDLMEPSSRGRSAGRSCPYVASSAWASIGSPSGVPVPWPSTASMSEGASPPLASAWRMTRCWEGPLGAVRPLEAPSWLMAEPRTTASTS